MIYKYNEFLLEYKARYSKSENIEDFADLYIDKIAKKLNVRLIKKLGMGSFGIAYLVDNDKVIKVTSDKNEAENARKLIDQDLIHFLNYHDVFEITLDGMDFSTPDDSMRDVKFSELYFILMDYVKPLSKDDKEKWSILFQDYFHYSTNDELFLDNVYFEFGDSGVKYFETFVKQRSEFLEEGAYYNIEFVDAHQDNLGIRKDGTLVYFDVGGYDEVTIYGDGGERKSFNIEKSDFENDFKKIKDLITTKYKPLDNIPIKDIVSDISKLLSANKVKSYKYLRDEVYSQFRKSSTNYEIPIWFTATHRTDDPDMIPRKLPHIKPNWKKSNMEIFLVFDDTYSGRII